MADGTPTTSTASTTLKVESGIQPEVHTEQSTGFVNFDVWGHHFSINPMVCLLFAGIIWVLYYLWKAQNTRGNDFDIWDLIMDTVPQVPASIPTQRKSSLIKIGYSFAFGVATWVVIDQQIKGGVSFEVFGLYLSAVFGTVCAKLLWDKPFDPATLLAMWGKQNARPEEPKPRGDE